MIKKSIYTKNTPEILNPQIGDEMKMFYTSKEAAKTLGVAELELLLLARKGLLQEFYDKDLVLFKREEVEELASKLIKEDDSLLEVYDFKVDNSVEISQSVDPKDISGTIMLWSWVLCAIAVFVGLFARRLYLLETAVPVLALIGFVFLGFAIVRHFKERNRIQLEDEKRIDTERLIQQAERLQKLNEINERKGNCQ